MNEFAESAADVGEGMQRSASVLAEGGASIQEAAGMITGIQEVIQDPESAGTALKILTLRIHGMKGQLQALGEDVDPETDTISKMQTQILNQTHGKVNIFDEQGNFKDIYKIMEEISKVYGTLSDPDKASLLETIAGKDRANSIQALITNWSDVEKATKAAYNSAGTSEQEQSIYMDSLAGKLETFKASWEAFSASFMKSDILKAGVSGLTKILNLLGQIQHPLLTIGSAALGIASSIKGIGLVKLIEDDTSKLGVRLQTQFTGIFKALGDKSGVSFSKNFISTLSSDLDYIYDYRRARDSGSLTHEEAFANTMGRASTDAKAYVNERYTSADLDEFGKQQESKYISGVAENKSLPNVKKLINEYNNQGLQGAKAQQEFTEAVGNSNSGLAKYLSSLNGAKASMGGYIKSLVSAKIATIGLEVASAALNAVLTMGISLAVTAAVTALSNLATRSKDLADGSKTMISNFKDASSEAEKNKESVGTLGDTYKKLAGGVNTLNNKNLTLSTDDYQTYLSTVNQIADTFPSLIEGYDAEGNAILSLHGKVKGLTEAYEEQRRASMKKIFEGDKKDHTDYKSVIDNFYNKTGSKKKGERESYIQSQIDNGAAVDSITVPTKNKEAIDSIDAILKDTTKYDSNTAALGLKEAGISAGKYKKAIEGAIDGDSAALDKYVTTLKNKKSEIEAETKEGLTAAKDMMSSYMQGMTDGYYDLDSSMQTFAGTIVNSLDETDIGNILGGETGEKAKDRIAGFINDLTTALSNPKVESLYNNINGLMQQGDTSTNLDKITKQLTSMSEATGIASDKLKSVFGLKDSYDSQDKLNNYLDKLEKSGQNVDDLRKKTASLDSTQRNTFLTATKNITNASQAWDKYKNSAVAAAVSSTESAKTIQDMVTSTTEYSNALATQDSKFVDKGATYDNMSTWLKSAADLYNKGNVGTEEFKAIAAAFDPYGSSDAESFKKNFSKYKRYFGQLDSEDKVDSQAGVKNFLNDMEDKGIVKQLKGGAFKLLSTDADEAAKKMGLAKDAYLSMMDEIEAKGGNVDFFETSADAEKGLADYTQKLIEAKNEYKNIKADKSLSKTEKDARLEQKKKEIDDLKAHIETTRKALEELLSPKKIKEQSDDVSRSTTTAYNIAKQYMDKNGKYKGESKEVKQSAVMGAAKQYQEYLDQYEAATGKSLDQLGDDFKKKYQEQAKKINNWLKDSGITGDDYKNFKIEYGKTTKSEKEKNEKDETEKKDVASIADSAANIEKYLTGKTGRDTTKGDDKNNGDKNNGDKNNGDKKNGGKKGGNPIANWFNGIVSKRNRRQATKQANEFIKSENKKNGNPKYIKSQANEYIKATGKRDFSKHKFGNLDLNSRQIMDWGNLSDNKSNLNKYKKELKSWGINPKDLEGSYSTVSGESATIGSGKYKGKEGIPIAYTPYLQTGKNGGTPKLLSQDTLYDYLREIVKGATDKNGKIDASKVLALDKKGITWDDGTHIQGMIAGAGEGADATAKYMHYLGTTGSIGNQFGQMVKDAQAAGVSMSDVVKQMGLTNVTIPFTADIGGVETAVQAVIDEKGNITYQADVNGVKTTIKTVTDEHGNVKYQADVGGVKATLTPIQHQNGTVTYEGNVEGVKGNLRMIMHQDGTITYSANIGGVETSLQAVYHKDGTITYEGDVKDSEYKVKAILHQDGSVTYEANVNGVEKKVKRVKHEDGRITYETNIDTIKGKVHAVIHPDGSITYTANVNGAKKKVNLIRTPDGLITYAGDTATATLAADAAKYVNDGKIIFDGDTGPAEQKISALETLNPVVWFTYKPRNSGILTNNGGTTDNGGSSNGPRKPHKKKTHKRKSGATGTLRLSPTSLTRAYAKGNVSVRRNQEAIVNELGTEGIIRNGVLSEIPGGMQKKKLRKGDIVVSASQMKALKEGRKTSHAKVVGSKNAFAQGTVDGLFTYATGGGSVKLTDDTVSYGGKKKSSSSKKSNRKSKNSTKKNTEATDKNTKSKNKNTKAEDKKTKAEEKRQKKADKLRDKFDNLQDWIEIWIDRVDKKISKFETLAGQTTRSINSRVKDFNKAMKTANKGYKKAGKSYQTYIKQANAIGLSSKYKNLVKNGDYDAIQKIKDPVLKEKISEYQELYEKAEEAQEKQLEWQQKIVDLEDQKLSSIQEHYEKYVDYHAAKASKYTAEMQYLQTIGAGVGPGTRYDKLRHQAATEYYKAAKAQHKGSIAYAQEANNAKTVYTSNGTKVKNNKDNKKAASKMSQAGIDWARRTANNNKHGYSQSNRWGPNYDCSSFVITATRQAGYNVGKATTTSNMRSNYKAHGWKEIKLTSKTKLRPGDILIRPGKHTELFSGKTKDGAYRTIGAHSNYDGKSGDSGGREVSEKRYSRSRIDRDFDYVLRAPDSKKTDTSGTTEGGKKKSSSKSKSSGKGKMYSPKHKYTGHIKLPKSVTRWRKIINKAAKKYKVPADVIANMIYRESSGNPKNKTGSHWGLMQLSPDVAREMGISSSDRLDPEKNVMAGVGYLKKMIDKNNGDLTKGIMSFRWGFTGAKSHSSKETYPTNALMKNQYSNGGGKAGSTKKTEPIKKTKKRAEKRIKRYNSKAKKLRKKINPLKKKVDKKQTKLDAIKERSGDQSKEYKDAKKDLDKDKAKLKKDQNALKDVEKKRKTVEKALKKVRKLQKKYHSDKKKYGAKNSKTKKDLSRLNDAKEDLRDTLDKTSAKKGKGGKGSNNDKVKETKTQQHQNVEAEYDQLNSAAEQAIGRREDKLTTLQYKSDKWTRVGERIDANADYIDAKNTSNKKKDTSFIENEKAHARNLVHENRADYKRLQELERQLTLYSPKDSKYQEIAGEIKDLKVTMMNRNTEMENIINTVAERFEQRFDEALDKLDTANSQAQSIVDYMGSESFVDTSGNITDNGYANIALTSTMINNNARKIQDYKNAIKEVEELAKTRVVAGGDPLLSEDEKNELIKKYQQGIQDAVSNNKQLKDSLISMYTTQLENQNQVLQENINLRKQSLQAKIDYYNYDKTLRDQNEDIRTLKAQEAALSGTSSAAGQAKLLKVREQLKEKQEEQDDTIRDHRNTMMSNGYDELSTDIQNTLSATETALQTNTKLQADVIQNMLDNATKNFQTASSTIEDTIKNSGLVVSDTLQDGINKFNSITTAANTFKNALDAIDFNKILPGEGGLGENGKVLDDLGKIIAGGGTMKDVMAYYDKMRHKGPYSIADNAEHASLDSSSSANGGTGNPLNSYTKKNRDKPPKETNYPISIHQEGKKSNTIKVGVGKTVTVEVDNGSVDKWSRIKFSKKGIAEVVTNEAKEPMPTEYGCQFKVKGLKDGTVTMSIKCTNGRTGKATVKVGKGGGNNKGKNNKKGYVPEYYKKYTGKSNSFVDALNSMGIDSSMSNRKKIASRNGIKNYTGTAAQNKKLLNLLKKDKLVKRVYDLSAPDMSGIVLDDKNLDNPNQTNGSWGTTTIDENGKVEPGITVNYDKKKNTPKYYKKYTGKSSSLVAALNALGINSSMSNRKKIAQANGIKDYSGTAAQNNKLLGLLKKGKLKKVAHVKGGTIDSLIPLANLASGDDGLITAQFGEGVLSKAFMSDVVPDFMKSVNNAKAILDSSIDTHSPTVVQIHYDNLLNVEGSVDKDALPDLKEILKQSYEYTQKNMAKDLRKIGLGK